MDSKRNLSHEELRLLVKILSLVRGRLENKRGMLVCLTVEDAYYIDLDDNTKHRWAVHYLIDWIEKMLHPYSTLTGWIGEHAQFQYWGVHDLQRQSRIAWVSWMITELENEMR